MSTDAELVAGVLAGDREAFAAVYDRYADRLYDFCHSVLRDRQDAEDAVQDTFVLVAQRLAQLNDPERLRPWLYAVARSVALRRTRARKRIVLDTEVSEMPDPDAGPQRAAEVGALRELVWSAAAGLSERDRALLDLHVRQGLDGAELGEAMGVSAGHAYVLLTRLRDQVERSLGALLIARLGRDDCAELSELLSTWDGRFTPLMRKRVARHVDKCAVCGERRRTMVSPIALLAAVPLVTAPLALRDRVLDRVELVAYERPAKPPRPSRLPMVAAATTLLVALGLATFWGRVGGLPGAPVAQDLLPTTSTPSGSTGSTAPTPPSALPPAATTTPPATTTTTRPGSPRTTTTTTTTTTPPQPPPPPPDTSPPDIVRQAAQHPRIFVPGCRPPNVNSVTATLVDDTGVASAILHWTGPDQQPGSTRMAPRGDVWFAQFPQFTLSGGVVWQITATDAAGNTATGPKNTFFVSECSG
ncbi:MAG TPA: sigma-70 family RNA polymerase sigma factor [Actinophytocola sp.]|uniref:sigma-70 family RNA polymerase sigma factor n=1 Tax=Actinophytocola sp. TaxID=1872138 RepID=UPI002DDCC58F|nr:sigma-70 family RNA polymerase sigma factor [Actinophytocola sp.]HEV2782353.1 sigma-70 family RNA polymerase sigma factor [Actinophytocola sp.]